MKIITNLVSTPGKQAPYIAIGLWLLSAMLVSCAIFIVWRVGQMSEEIPALKTRLEQFNNSRQKGSDTAVLPPRDELAMVKDSIAAINQLSGPHSGSLLSALLKLEDQLPQDVSLVELSYRRRAGEVRMTADAARSDAVGNVLQGMERSGHYSEVLLVRQFSSQDIPSGRMQFEIQLRERK